MLPAVSEWLGSFVSIVRRLVSRKHDTSHQMKQGCYPGFDARMAELKQKRTTRCLLSLDGGGIRGFSQIFILEEIANRIKHDSSLTELPRLCDYFDMVGGVGTGGYLAILVGRLGLTVPQLKQEFFDFQVHILTGPIDSFQLDCFLKAVVKKYTGDSETLMFDPNSLTHHCKTFVGAVKVENVGNLTKFRSYEAREGPSPNCPIWQAARATLACPNLFPDIKIGPELLQQVYISGEVGWKNPSEEIIREFEALWPKQSLACLASIGTGHEGTIKIDRSTGSDSLNMAMGRIATEKIAQEVGYRFEGQNIYFRLSVEQGLQEKVLHKPLTFEEIEAHTKAYLGYPGITVSIDKLVLSILNAIAVSTRTATRDHFSQTMDEYISRCKICVDEIPIEEAKSAAEEVILTLKTICGVKSNADSWLALAEMINSHFAFYCVTIVKSQDPLSTNPLWGPIKNYFTELRIVRMESQEVLKSHPHRIWGPSAHEDFLSKCRATLDSCFKRIKDTMLKELYRREVFLQEAKEAEELWAWLSPLDFNRRHNDVRAKRSEGTGNWFINTSEFQTWFTNRNPEGCRALCSYGVPGAGKTVLCSLAIDHLLQATYDGKTGVAYIYCDYRDQDSQTLANVIGDLAKQLLKQTSTVPSNIWEIFTTSQKNSNKRITTEASQQIFPLVLLEFDSIFICIDALDECERRMRMQLLQFFNALTQRSLHVFLTGRHNVEHEVCKAIESFSPRLVPIAAKEEDIRICLAQEIIRDLDPDAMDEHLKEDIIQKIVSLSCGSFMLPVFQIQTVLDQVTKSDRRLALTTMPTGLFDIYKVTLERIKAQSEGRYRLASLVLTWVYLAKRQLHVDELRHALAVKSGHNTFDEDGMPSQEVFLGCCLGLVVVEAETSTVRLTHFTLQEYLDKTWMILFPLGHSVIATTCLTYLNFDHKGKSLQEIRNTSPLIDYATHNVGHHLSKGNNSIPKEQTLAILHEKKTFQLLEEALGCILSGWEALTITPLHWAAYFGVTTIVRLLLNSSEDSRINAKDIPYGKTALSYAAENGHKEIVEVLISTKAVVVDSLDDEGRTPLSYAAARGHEGIVQTLINTEGVTIDLPDKYGQTPLSHAAGEGHGGIVQTLINTKGVTVNSADKDGWTPLCHAAAEGHEQIVHILIGTEGVAVNPSNKYGRTPLSYAAANCHEGVVQILLSTKGVDVDSKDNKERTPLSWAAGAGSWGDNPLAHAPSVVQLLLEQSNINPDSKDNKGHTPLSYAAEIGNVAVVQLLLKQNVNINSMDTTGQTALSYATKAHPTYSDPHIKENCGEVMQLLLEHGASNIQALDESHPSVLTDVKSEDLGRNVDI